MDSMPAPASLSDRALIGEVKRLAACERHATAALICSLAELDARRLYLGEGCPSLFSYCTQVLRLSEHAAYHRIEAARAGRRCPLVLERLVSGDVTLTAVGLLAPLLTADNGRELLDAARHGSKREVEEIVARLRPRPDSPTCIRRLPQRPGAEEQLTLAGGTKSCNPDQANDAPAARESETREPAPCAPPRSVPPPRPAVVRPLAPARYQLQVTISAETRAKLQRAQDLLRHAVPDGDPAEVIDRALTLLVGQLERHRMKLAKRPGCGKDGPETADRSPRSARRDRCPSSVAGCPDAPRQPGEGETPRSRYVPAAAVREVWARDAARCAFVGTEGRCPERGFLQLHHRIPFAEGGPPTVENLELRCRAHNQFEAEQHFGLERVAGARERKEGSRRRRREARKDLRGSDGTRSGPS